jgi:amino acid transporter
MLFIDIIKQYNMEDLANNFATGLLFVMLFFSISITRNVHKTLDRENAGNLLRIIFPEYFFWGVCISFLSTILFFFSKQNLQTIIIFVVFLSSVFSRYFLIPRIDNARNLMITGNENASKKFSNLHRISVSINLLQIILLLITMIYTVIT